MKSSTIPPLRVTSEFRAEAESVLREGESLSRFAEEALRRQIEFRKMQRDFLARGLAARDAARESGVYVPLDEVMGSLRSLLSSAKHEK
jgi:predicted transcriptional regulator